MRAGLLNEHIQIITPIINRNDYGEEETVWENKYSTRARLMHNSGKRTLTNEIYYQYTKTFEVRYYVPITEFDRIIWNKKVYRIIDIEPNKEQQKITIVTELLND